MKNLQEVFQTGQRLLIPLFQRPYVWTEEKQWVPPWDDVLRLTEGVALDQFITTASSLPSRLQLITSHFA